MSHCISRADTAVCGTKATAPSYVQLHHFSRQYTNSSVPSAMRAREASQTLAATTSVSGHHRCGGNRRAPTVSCNHKQPISENKV